MSTNGFHIFHNFKFYNFGVRYRHVGLLGNFYSALFFYEKQKAAA